MPRKRAARAHRTCRSKKTGTCLLKAPNILLYYFVSTKSLLSTTSPLQLFRLSSLYILHHALLLVLFSVLFYSPNPTPLTPLTLSSTTVSESSSLGIWSRFPWSVTADTGRSLVTSGCLSSAEMGSWTDSWCRRALMSRGLGNKFLSRSVSTEILSTCLVSCFRSVKTRENLFWNTIISICYSDASRIIKKGIKLN